MKLELIFKELRDIKTRLDELERLFINRHYTFQNHVPESKLLELPDSLRKTYIAIASRQQDSTATDVSAATGRVRAIESLYLNQLVRMGYLTKHQNSKNKVFRLCEN